MKNYTTPLFLAVLTFFSSCHDDEFVQAESFEDIVKEITEIKNNSLTKGKTCFICDFEATTPEVIYCDNGLNEDNKNVVLQISKGTVVELVDITIQEQIEKVSKSATCKVYTGE